MQKFTRPLTREIELGGERIALTLGQDGVIFRLVGSRKPPYEISWTRLLCAATRSEGDEAREPTAEELAAAVEAVKKGATPRPAGQPSPQAAPPTAPGDAPAGAGLPNLLDRLSKWLQQHRPGMLDALRPGARQDELDAFQIHLGIPTITSLRTLLAWHNGQKEDSLGGFEQDWRLMSTTQIEQARQELQEDPQNQGRATAWQPAWLPLFEDGNGSYLFLDTNTTAAPVRAYWAGQAEQPVVAPSLEAWFQDFVSAVEKGEYHEEAERGTFLRKR